MILASFMERSMQIERVCLHQPHAVCLHQRQFLFSFKHLKQLFLDANFSCKVILWRVCKHIHLKRWTKYRRERKKSKTNLNCTRNWFFHSFVRPDTTLDSYHRHIRWKRNNNNTEYNLYVYRGRVCSLNNVHWCAVRNSCTYILLHTLLFFTYTIHTSCNKNTSDIYL